MLSWGGGKGGKGGRGGKGGTRYSESSFSDDDIVLSGPATPPFTPLHGEGRPLTGQLLRHDSLHFKHLTVLCDVRDNAGIPEQGGVGASFVWCSRPQDSQRLVARVSYVYWVNGTPKIVIKPCFNLICQSFLPDLYTRRVGSREETCFLAL